MRALLQVAGVGVIIVISGAAILGFSYLSTPQRATDHLPTAETSIKMASLTRNTVAVETFKTAPSEGTEVLLPIYYKAYDADHSIDFGFSVHSDTYRWQDGETVYLSLFLLQSGPKAWTYNTDTSWSTTTPSRTPFISGKVRPLLGSVKGVGGYAALFDPEITVPADLEYPARDPQGLLVARVILDNDGRGDIVGISSIR